VSPCLLYGQIGNVPAAIFEVFHPTSHTAVTYAGMFIDVRSQCKTSAAELFAFVRNSATECWGNDASFIAILLQWIINKYGAHALELYFRLQETDAAISPTLVSIISGTSAAIWSKTNFEPTGHHHP
jgi:hypothetical protein